MVQVGYTDHCLIEAKFILPELKFHPQTFTWDERPTLSATQNAWLNNAYQSNFRVIGSIMNHDVEYQAAIVAA